MIARKNMKRRVLIISIILSVCIFVSCSSSPEKAAEITTLRGMGKTQLDLAGREIDRGNYDDAMLYLFDAWNYAVRSDDPELRIKVRLTRGNAYFYQGDDAAAHDDWQAAILEAEQDENEELTAAAKIHLERGRLLKAINDGSSAEIEEIKTIVSNEMDNIKDDQLYTALAWTVLGLAEKEQKLYDDAEESFANALEIHEKDNYLEQAAYDWYLIASVRSMSLNYDAAVEALMNSVSFDRRAENSHGLGSDWKALGDVYAKMGDNEKSQNAYARSKEIFDSLAID
jgi:tetratricopeptide (TPR) repeat protein